MRVRVHAHRYPKAKQYTLRWHGSPCFPILLYMGAPIEVLLRERGGAVAQKRGERARACVRERGIEIQGQRDRET